MKSRRMVVVSIVTGLLFLCAGAGFGQQQDDGKVSMTDWTKIIDSKVAEQVGDKGIVNYEEGYIEAVGTGAPPEKYYGKPNARPMALRAAQVDAYRNLLEVTKGVQIDSQTTVKDFVTESDVINTQVSGLIKGAKVTNKEYLSDGTVEVTVRMPLSGIAKAIYPKAFADDKKTDQPPPRVRVRPTPAGGDIYTGLVIDARGLQARPAMSPKVIDENGKEVYGSLVVNKDYAVQQGISGYARDLTAAQGNARVTNNPVTVKGLSAEGAGKSDIKISNDDAMKLRSVKENVDFMKKCRVMIVLD
jgi:hypothetical protein